MGEIIKSRRGVYYDLKKSPYEYYTPYGDLFKFSSQKKLDIYRREIVKECDRLKKLLDRNGLGDYIPDEIIWYLYRAVYRSFYDKIEG